MASPLATPNPRRSSTALAAEFAGTFMLVFAGTGAIVVDHATQGAVTHVGISLTFGLVVMAAICAFAASSGAHFNPAVTIGFYLANRFDGSKVAAYLAAQCAGAIAASAAIKAFFPADATLGATLPRGAATTAFGFELVLTFFLVTVILHATRGGGAFGSLAPFAIGGTVAFDALVGGPISGASMNPARSLGPALIAGIWNQHWIYWIAPLAGCLLAVLLDRLFPHPDPATP